MRILPEILSGLEVTYNMNESRKIKTSYIIMTVIAVIAVLCILVFCFVFKATSVTIEGNDICTEEQIKDNYISGPLGSNTIVIWLKNKLGIYEPIPFIREAQIDVSFPSNVKIHVYEKTLVAYFYYMGQYIYFDKDGMILETSSENIKDVPCIEGISFTNFALYEHIEVSKEGQIDTILDLSELISHYGMDVDKVSFNNKNEVTLYCGNIKVFLGKQSLYDQQIASVSDVIRQAVADKLSGTIDMKNYKQGDKIILRS